METKVKQVVKVDANEYGLEESKAEIIEKQFTPALIEQEAELKKEREEKAKLEAELRAKKEAEQKAKQEAEEKQRQSLLAPDKDKLKEFAEMLYNIEVPEIKDKDMNLIAETCKTQLDKINKYIINKLKE